MTKPKREEQPISEQVIREWLKQSKHKKSPWGETLDSNEYAKPLFDTQYGVCFICGAEGDTARHEVFYGTADRQTSKAVGCWVYVCPKCHEKIHNNANLDKALKMSMQILFERIHTRRWGKECARDEFMALFGRNYL